MKKFLFILLVSLFVLVGCNNNNTAEYKSNLQDVADKILENSSKAEEILNQYAIIWRFSIESGTAIGVGEMSLEIGLNEDVIREHFELNSIGNIPGDFSTNIHSLNSYYAETGELGKIEETSKEIKGKINELNNPPEEYEKVYNEVLDMYTYSEEYIEMALNPTGSLQSFNEERSQLSSDILSKYKRIEVIIPGEE